MRVKSTDEEEKGHEIIGEGGKEHGITGDYEGGEMHIFKRSMRKRKSRLDLEK